MISDNNKEYLKKTLNIEVNKYSDDELNILLDKIMIVINENIKNKINHIKQLKEIIIKDDSL